ncbi:MAG TPA: Gfo/Idh/MocA family oxidoreductase [Steroidobacteraceae bacterium]|nr:Gfo/Idh/MocA family oxidoreductase [Steroidobacteraceae bacterium]
MKRKDRVSRRQFLQTTMGAAGASFAAATFLESPPLLAAGQMRAPSDRVRFGIVGVGMEGSGLLRTAIALPGVECAAACDLYDGRHELAREIVGKSIPTTRRYQELLDNKEIDAIIVAVPDHWHKQVVVDALAAGKDVYCEKPFSHSAADGLALVAAASKSDRIVQVGAQRTSSVLCAKAKELYDSGAIGKLSLVEGTLGRNDPTGAWEYPPPPDLSPKNLDWDTWLGTAPKKAFDPLVFARWRCWKEYGTGVAGDLLVHLLSGMQFVLGINEIPKRVSAFGGIYRWNDGRNTPDVHPVLFEYADVPVYMRLSLGTETTEVTRFMGSKGIIELTESGVSYSPQAGIDLSPSYYAAALPSRLRDAYYHQWHAEHDPKPGQEPAAESVSFKGNDYDDLRPHLWKFFEAVRSRQPVVQDAVFGHNAALGCHMANESYYRKLPVHWDPVAQVISSQS